jgi:hypothetical protein
MMRGLGYGFGVGFGWQIGIAVGFLLLFTLGTKVGQAILSVVAVIVVLGALSFGALIYQGIAEGNRDNAISDAIDQRCYNGDPNSDEHGHWGQCWYRFEGKIENIYTVEACGDDKRKAGAYTDCLIAYWTKHGVERP